jgi:four helix bundle protein
MSYRNLEIWKLADELVKEVHLMTLQKLPKYELYEIGSQIRRSSKSVKSNIVEGYGRRIYKQEYINFLVIAIASNNETIDHLETLFTTGSLKDETAYNSLTTRYEKLGKMIYSYIESVRNDYKKKCKVSNPIPQYPKSNTHNLIPKTQT